MAELQASRTGGRLPLPRELVHGERGGVLAWLEYLAYRALTGTLAALPTSLQDAFAGGLARLAARFDRRHSDAARGYLDQAFRGELTEQRREQLVRASYKHLIQQTVRDTHFNRRVVGPDLASHFDLHVCAEAQAVQQAPGGFLVISAHVGSWEAFGATGPVLGYDPAYAVSRPPKNRPLSVYFQRMREGRALNLIHRHGAVRGITQVVQAGGCVTLLLDQRAHGKTVLAPMFGRLAHCERSIAVLIRRLKVPVLIGACYETGTPYQYEIQIPRAILPEEFAGLPPEQILAEINGELERMILARPEQYFWLHDRYRKAPPVQPDADAAQA